MTSSQVTAIRDVPTLEGEVSEEEWEARVDLAACYRLAHSHGWNRNIYNHTSHRVPGEADMFLIKPHVLLWDEIRASNLIQVNVHGELDERAGVNRPGYVLHSAILRARPDVNAVVHIHEEASIAVSTMKDGLLPLTQEAIFLYGRVAYHEYSGITEDAAERAALVRNLGDKSAMMMRSHGSVTVGADMREAYRWTEHLVNGSRVQLQLMASDAELTMPSDEICRRTSEQYAAHNRGRGLDDWPAALREIDQIDPSYRT